MRSEEMVRKVLLSTIGLRPDADGDYPRPVGDDVLGILEEGSKGRAVHETEETLIDCEGWGCKVFTTSIAWWDSEVQVIDTCVEHGNGVGYPSTRYLNDRLMSRGEFMFYAKAGARLLGIDIEWN